MSNSIYHHGIKGQKWGIKNGPSYPLSKEQRSPEEKKKNGAISDSGKERYGKDGISSNTDSNSHEGVHSIDASKITYSTKKSLIKNASDMSDDELRKAITRLNNEKRLKQVIAEQFVDKPPDTKVVKEILQVAKNSTAVASAGAKLVGKKDVGDALSLTSGLFDSGVKKINAKDTIRDRQYNKKINSIARKIDLSELSDDELKSIVNRINLEQTYNSLKENSQYTQRGKEKVLEILGIFDANVEETKSNIEIANSLKKLANRNK